MRKPLVAVVDWKQSPRGDKKCVIEKEVIGKVANVKYFLCDEDKDWKGQLLNADTVLLWHNTRLSGEVIARLKNCKAIIRNGAGYDTVNYLDAACYDIPVCNVPDYGVDEVADHSIALALSLTRQIIPINEECKNLGWEIPNKNLIRRHNTMNFGVVGLGRIGSSVALKAKALGFNVFFFDPYLTNGVDKSMGIKRYKELNNFIPEMDVISINCPLTDETKYMFTSKELRLMRKNSFIVNTARGPIIKKKDLFLALKKGIIGGAALDVIEDEPLKTKEEAKTPNLIVTCHSAFFSSQSVEEMRSKAAQIAKNALLGEDLENCINCNYLPRNYNPNE